MILKKITCHVVDFNGFNEAQKMWNPISTCTGFIKQIGGMVDEDAIIYSYWEDKEALDSFMNGLHDEIVLKNKQSLYYDSILVEIYEVVREEVIEFSIFDSWTIYSK